MSQCNASSLFITDLSANNYYAEATNINNIDFGIRAY